MGISAFTTVPRRPSLDVVGASASLICAVHCVLVVALLGVAPAVSSLLAAPWIDWGFLALSAAVGVFALVPGYRRHRLRTPLVLFTVGISALVVLRSMHAGSSIAELSIVGIAAACLVTAHWKNRGAVHSCACGPRHH